MGAIAASGHLVGARDTAEVFDQAHRRRRGGKQARSLLKT